MQGSRKIKRLRDFLAILQILLQPETRIQDSQKINTAKIKRLRCLVNPRHKSTLFNSQSVSDLICENFLSMSTEPPKQFTYVKSGSIYGTKAYFTISIWRTGFIVEINLLKLTNVCKVHISEQEQVMIFNFISKYMKDIYKGDFSKAVHFDREGFIRANYLTRLIAETILLKAH